MLMLQTSKSQKMLELSTGTLKLNSNRFDSTPTETYHIHIISYHDINFELLPYNEMKISL